MSVVRTTRRYLTPLVSPPKLLRTLNVSYEGAGKTLFLPRYICFSPDTLRALASELGLAALPRPYRSPDPPAG